MEQWNGNVEAFRTYFHGRSDKDGKSIPAEKVKGMPGHPWGEVCNDENFGAVLNDGIIDASFDSRELSTAVWNMAAENNWQCLILENPLNGQLHTVWKKPFNWKYKDGKDLKLACGLIADIHSGSTYIRLRDNGVDRFPPLFEPKHIQELPEELYPVNTKIDLWELAEGDGRNDALSRMAKYLVYNTHFTKEQITQIITNANKFVLNEPVNNDELDTILRDETFRDMEEVPKLNTFSAAELFYMDVKPVEFVIEGLIPVGMVILASPPKYGKSYMCLDMALSVSMGRDFLGFHTNQYRVLYLSLEDRKDRLKQRIGQVLAGEAFPELLRMEIESATLDSGFIEQLGDFLQEYPDTKLVIIDTFIKIRGEPKRNESAYGTDSREAGIIKKFADQHGIAVVLVTHTRKGIDPNDPFVNT